MPTDRKYNTIHLKNPITNCEIFYNGLLKTINIFTNKQKHQQRSEFDLNTDIAEFNTNRLQQKISQQQKTSNIYVGKYNSQIYAQNIKFDDEGEDSKKKETFKLLFDNNKELLQKTKSTMNNLVIHKNNKYKYLNKEQNENQQQQQHSLAIISKKDYDIFFQEAKLVDQKDDDNQNNNDNDDDDDDDDDVNDNASSSHQLAYNDESHMMPDFDLLISSYIQAIIYYKAKINIALYFSSAIFILFLYFKRFVVCSCFLFLHCKKKC